MSYYSNGDIAYIRRECVIQIHDLSNELKREDIHILKINKFDDSYFNDLRYVYYIVRCTVSEVSKYSMLYQVDYMNLKRNTMREIVSDNVIFDNKDKLILDSMIDLL